MIGVEPANIQRRDDLFTRILAFTQERFPLLNHGLLIASYYSSNQFLAHALAGTGVQMHYTLNSLLGAVVVFLFFFHLRVFDEHKDYEHDCEHHPDRLLQRGVVTLDELKVLGAGAIGLEAFIAFSHSWGAFVAWSIAFGFSLLMLVEFFVPDWLEERFLLYALSHMLVMPLLAFVVYGFATGQMPWEAPPHFWLYSLVGFFVMFNWEISRKIRAPEQERDGIDSYTKELGTYGAPWAVLGVRVVDTALVAIVGYHIGLAWWFYAALVALFAVTLVGFVQFRTDPSPETAERMESYAGLYIVAFDVAVAVAIAAKFGMELPFGLT